MAINKSTRWRCPRWYAYGDIAFKYGLPTFPDVYYNNCKKENVSTLQELVQPLQYDVNDNNIRNSIACSMESNPI